MASKYRKWIIIIAGLAIPVTLWLVFSELSSPGFCPALPVLGIPACYAVLLFFLLVLVSQFVRKSSVWKFLFQLGAIPGLFTAVWFSVQQAKGELNCPQLLSLPLCYVSLATFLLLIILQQVRCIDEGTCELPG